MCHKIFCNDQLDWYEGLCCLATFNSVPVLVDTGKFASGNGGSGRMEGRHCGSRDRAFLRWGEDGRIVPWRDGILSHGTHYIQTSFLGWAALHRALQICASDTAGADPRSPINMTGSLHGIYFSLPRGDFQQFPELHRIRGAWLCRCSLGLGCLLPWWHGIIYNRRLR